MTTMDSPQSTGRVPSQSQRRPPEAYDYEEP